MILRKKIQSYIFFGDKKNLVLEDLHEKKKTKKLIYLKNENQKLLLIIIIMKLVGNSNL